MNVRKSKQLIKLLKEYVDEFRSHPEIPAHEDNCQPAYRELIETVIRQVRDACDEDIKL